MADDVQASFAYAAHRYSSAVTDLLLVGGGADVAGVAQHLARRLGLKVRVLTPTDLAECPASLVGKCRSAALSPAVGLALYGCRGLEVAA
jgi:Tfp pilus assembly PilM family ATPase